VKKFLFVGKVYPEESGLTIKEILVEDLTGLLGNDNHKLRIEILNSIIRAELETDAPLDLPTARNSVEYFISGLVDAYGYYSGSAFDVRLSFGIGPEGEFTFPPVINEIAKDKVARPLQPERLIVLSAKFPKLHRALSDLREAIKHPMDTSFYCFRLTEAIRQHFVNKNQKDEAKAKRESWDEMGKSLLFEKSFKDELEKEAKYTRHGDVKDLTSEDIMRLLKKVWILLDRFVIYLNDGQRELNQRMFKMLK